MRKFLQLFKYFALSFSILLPQLVLADNPPVPQGAVQVTPEEFKELKKDENRKIEGPGDIIGHSIQYSGAGNSKDAAILIFAVVGTVVLVAWIPYMVLLAYRGLRHPENYVYHYQLSTQVTRITNGEASIERSGFMNALKFTPLIGDKIDPSTVVKKTRTFYGLNVELGRFNFKDFDNNLNRELKYNAYYWLLGPSFVFGNLDKVGIKEIFYFKLDLLAGTSFNRDVNLILRSEFSVNRAFKNKLSLGFGGGANYLNGQRGKGIVNYRDNYSLHYFLNFGFIY